MGNKSKILKSYIPCIDIKCVNRNNIHVKKVFEDLNYIPLCSDCIRKHRKKIKEFHKKTLLLSVEDITDTYFEALNMRGQHGFI